ncbi:aminopeptidase P family protein [Bifidobacterium sp. CP2]|uniref:M24 family metallopeptidase n=1 Tax=Bifidobacterium sp. CP2 TaxID=2809025 RepID=UPI001BDC232D|nr:Xaa-Pro peptidase family protein [Bifidobacterium sp. CP2]MBT1182290.1 aminopeptidase P family protein [Bifidobacterium sp. CP2]
MSDQAFSRNTNHPTDHAIKIGNIVNQLRLHHQDAWILSSPAGIFYTTGFQSGLSRGTGRTGALSVVTADGEVHLVLAEFEAEAARLIADPSVHIETYPVWIYIEEYSTPGVAKEVQPADDAAINIAVDILKRTLKPGGDGTPRVGIQTTWLNYTTGRDLLGQLAAYEVEDIESAFYEARVIKTPDEVAKLRFNAQAAEAAMNLTARAVVPGMSTRDVYAIYKKHCLERTPNATELTGFHTIGHHFSPYFDPADYTIRRGDIIRLDGGPYTYGYKSDIARTFVVGDEVDSENQRIYDRLWEGFHYGVEHAGPGVRFSDLYKGIAERIHLDEYAYVRGHFGHSISCGEVGEEAPFIAPNEDRPLEPGMVLCLETPFYSSKHQTYNIEDTFVVTEDGVEFFTHASPSLHV